MVRVWRADVAFDSLNTGGFTHQIPLSPDALRRKVSSPSGVVLAVQGLEALASDMGIDLRGRDVGMAE